jgi:hypothetical protein
MLFSKSTESRVNVYSNGTSIGSVHKFIGQAGTSPVYNEYEFSNGFMFA